MSAAAPGLQSGHVMPRLRSLALVVLFGSMTFACHRVRVDEVRGPDGGEWKRLQCKHMDQRCYKVAQQMCPNGYYFTYADAKGNVVRRHDGVTASGGASDRDGDGIADDASDHAPPAAPAPQSGNVKVLPPQNQWGKDMYSWHKGTILVKCASRAENRASN